MTVAELIQKLMKIEDKDLEVLVKSSSRTPSKARFVENGSVNYEGVIWEAEKKIIIE